MLYRMSSWLAMGWIMIRNTETFPISGWWSWTREIAQVRRQIVETAADIQRLFLFILLMLIVLATVMGLPHGMQADKLTSQEFVQILDSGQIAEVSIRPNAQTPTGEAVVTLTSGDVIRQNFTDVQQAQKLFDDRGIDYVIEEVPQENYLVTILLPFMLSIVVVVVILMVMNRGAAGGGGANARMMNFGKSRARLSRDSKVNFSNVAGLKEEKEELEEDGGFSEESPEIHQRGRKDSQGTSPGGTAGNRKDASGQSCGR